MDSYQPVDERADDTLHALLDDYGHVLTQVENVGQIVQIASDCLPQQVAFLIELELKLQRVQDLETARTRAYDIVMNTILQSAAQHHTVQNGRSVHYYTREDLLAWWQTAQHHYRCLNEPDEEIITITVAGLERPTNLSLTTDQMNGIAFALTAADPDKQVSLTSSITDSLIDIEAITAFATAYTTSPPTAFDDLKRPYRVNVHQSNGTVRTLYFMDPQFMQGIMSVALWLGLPNYGKNVLWDGLLQFTREGLVPLTF